MCAPEKNSAQTRGKVAIMSNAENWILEAIGAPRPNEDFKTEVIAEDLKRIPTEALQNVFKLSMDIIEELYKSPELPSTILTQLDRFSSLLAFELARRATTETTD